MSTMKNRLTLASLILLTSLGAGVGGCDKNKAPGSAVGDPVPLVNHPKIICEGGLGGRGPDGVGFIGVSNVIPDAGPPMDVAVTIRALTDGEELRVQWRYVFFDGKGRRIQSEPDWHFSYLPSRTPVELRGNAVDPKAVDWQLQIRPAR